MTHGVQRADRRCAAPLGETTEASARSARAAILFAFHLPARLLRDATLVLFSNMLHMNKHLQHVAQDRVIAVLHEGTTRARTTCTARQQLHRRLP